MTKYHLTIHTPNRKQKIDPDDFNYLQAYLWFDHKIDLSNITIENGKYGGNHIHCIARTVVPVSYKQLSTFAGYRLYWKQIKCNTYLQNIKEYHKKDLHKQLVGNNEDELYMSSDSDKSTE